MRGVFDVLVLGGGPSGVALAAELGRCGLKVQVVAPHPPRPFAPTYGAWLDTLPTWAKAATQHVWTDVRVYTGSAPTPLLRPYALLDNARLLQALLERAEQGLTWTIGTAQCAQPVGEVWAVRGSQGERWTARLVVDAAGHGGLLRPSDHPGGQAWQTAYGVVAHFDRPPSPPGAAVWMDYRAPHLAQAQVRALPTFLYAMHLHSDVYFVEETSLIARPAPVRADLSRRLYARLHANGTPPRQVISSEWVAFPMNAAAPAPGPLLAFGAAAGLVHPISGFQVAGALSDAPQVAQAVAQALQSSVNRSEDAAQAGWEALWPSSRRAARDLHLLGVGALLGLPGAALPDFFRTFFNLPQAQWQGFLDPRTATPELARTMLQVFAQAPSPVRRTLAGAGLAHPLTSLRALAATWAG